MKNVHLLPTDKPSNLTIRYKTKEFGYSYKKFVNQQSGGIILNTNQNIYITSSEEEIKEGDSSFYPPFGVGKNIVINNELFNGELCFHIEAKNGKGSFTQRTYQTLDKNKKVILTTDSQLIANGVQAIDEDFLEWFVKNPSCEEVKIESWQTKGEWDLDYKIIIPEEEPKQETLEEAALRLYPKYSSDPYNPTEDVLEEERSIFIAGAKWQQERSYSETEVLQLLLKLQQTESYDNLYDWFEQFKKK